MRLKTIFIMLCVLFFLATIASAQVSCVQSGNMVSCIGPQGNTTTMETGGGSGIITQYGNGQSSLTPYTITPDVDRSRREIDPSTFLDRYAPSHEPESLPAPVFIPYGTDAPVGLSGY